MPNWKKVIVSGSDASLNSLDVAGDITGSDVTIDDWGSISASLASINATGSNQNLQQVTDNGSVTTNSITASAFSGSDIVIDDWGSVSASLASIDSSVTLQDATDNGNTTTNDIILSGSLVFGLPDNNISIGKDSLLGSSMVQNIAIGTNALKSGSDNGINIAIGHSALASGSAPGTNLAIGNSALFYYGLSNATALGHDSLTYATVAGGATGVGRRSLGGAVNAAYSTAVGYEAGYGNSGVNVTTVASSSTFIGYQAKPFNSQSINEIVIGAFVTGNGNNTVTIGNPSITNNYFSGNISGSDITIDDWGSISASLASIESGASSSNQNLQQVTDQGNTTTNDIFVGSSVRIGNGTGSISTNTVVGSASFANNTSGYANTAVGGRSLEENTTGYNNTAVGYLALNGVETGYSNVAIGRFAMTNAAANANTNTAIGDQAFDAGYGNGNTVIGQSAFSGAQLASYNNVMVGQGAGSDDRNGNQNYQNNNSIFIGSGASSFTQSAVSNEIVIGYNAIGKGANTVVIGNSNITNNYFSGDISSSDAYIDDWGSISASLADIAGGGAVGTLQQVTDNGATTTNAITASQFVVSSSTDSANVVLDVVKDTLSNGASNTVLTSWTSSYAESVTIDYVTFDSGKNNKRAGTIRSTWNSSTVVFDETSTSDIGNTSALTLDLNNNTGTIQLRGSNSTGQSMTVIANLRFLQLG